MIKFTTIRWKNFLSTGSAFTEIKLDKTDNTLIIGENGAGKSTILDALCYNLFGKPFRNINLPTLVNSINGSDLVTESEFVIGTNKYKVIRGMKPALFEIYKDGKLIDQPGKIDYQEYLETFILRWNRKTFTQVVVLGNANFTPFMQLKAADRRAIIEDILDIQIFSTMNKLLKSRIDGVDQKIVENKHEEQLVKKESDIKEKHLAELQKNKQKEIDDIEEKIEDTNELIKKLQKLVKIQELKVKSMLGSEDLQAKQGYADKLKKSEGFLVGIESNLNKANTDINFWISTETCPTCDASITEEKKQKKLDYFERRQQQYKNGLKMLEDKMKMLQVSIKAIEQKEREIAALNSSNSLMLSEVGVLTKVLLDYEKKKNQLTKAKGDLDAISTELADLQEKLVLLEESREELLNSKAHYDIVGQLLKDNGIKSRIIKQYLPIINKLVNKYLAEQDFFVNFELDETFKEVIKSRYRDEFSYENFSEGEKQKIDMSLMLTWREIAKLKNSVATNILILDEIFDSSLDAQGVEYLTKLVHSLEKCNLFVISHRGDILQDKFKSVVKFERVGNYSRII